MIKKNFCFCFLIFLLTIQSYAKDVSQKGIPIEQIQQILADPDYTMEKRLSINIKKRLRKNPSFIKFYTENNLFIFKTAFIRAIAESGDNKLYKYLVPYLNDDNEKIAASAINAIGYANTPDYINDLAFLLNKYNDNELMIVRILATLGNSLSDEAIKYISPMIDDHRINISYAAVLSLSQIGTDKAASHLIKKYEYQKLRKKIIYSLGKCRTSNKALNFINHISKKDEHPYFLDIVKAMGELESHENTNYLIGLLDKNNKKQTFAALYALSRIADINSVTEIYNFLDSIMARTVQKKIFSAIEKICSFYSKQEIIETISGLDHPALVAIKLGKLGDPSSTNVLLELLEDDDPINKIFAIEAISVINDTSVVENLISRLSTSEPLETYCIMNYLKKCYENKLITREDLIEKISNYSYNKDKLNIFYGLIDYYEMEDGIISILANESNPYLWVMIDAVKNWSSYPSITHLLKYYLQKGSLPLRYHSAKILVNFAGKNPEIKSFLKNARLLKTTRE